MNWLAALLYVLGLVPMREMVADVQPRWWLWRPMLAIVAWPLTIAAYLVCWPFRMRAVKDEIR